MTNYSGEPLAVVVADDLSDDFDYSDGEIKVNFPAQQDTSIYALKNGDSNEPFKVKDATNDNEAVTKKQLDAAVAGNTQDTSIYALKNGDSNEPFKVKDATNNNEALSKGQLLSEIKAIDGSGSEVDADKVDGFDASQTPTPNTVAVADANGVLNSWIAQGEGSGLDADLVRGLPADFTSSKTVNGYQKLPSGLIIQWGEVSNTNTNPNVKDFTDITFALPITFQNDVLSIVCTNENMNTSVDYDEGNENSVAINSYDNSSVTIRLQRLLGVTSDAEEIKVKILVIGY